MKAGIRRNVGVTILGAIAGLAFIASLASHLSTFMPRPTISMDTVVVPIGIAIFVTFGGMVVILAVQRQTARKRFRELAEQTNEEANREFDRIGRVFRAVPIPVLLLGVALVIYAVVNFVVAMGLNSGGQPVEDNGQYYLSEHGHYVRELTEDEYHQRQAYELRGVSGHMMLFSYVPFAYFTFIHHNLRDEAEIPGSA